LKLRGVKIIVVVVVVVFVVHGDPLCTNVSPEAGHLQETIFSLFKFQIKA
jgi:hypothetical protein